MAIDDEVAATHVDEQDVDDDDEVIAPADHSVLFSVTDPFEQLGGTEPD